MTLVRALLLGIATIAAAPSATAASAAGSSAEKPVPRYVVVFSGGSEIAVVAPPKFEWGRVIYELPNGRLAMSPATSIDRAATEARNGTAAKKPEEPPPAPAPAPADTPESPGAAARRARVERALRELEQRSGTGNAANAIVKAELRDGETKAAAEEPSAGYDGYKDAAGRGEEEWRNRGRAARERIVSAEAQVAARQKELDEVQMLLAAASAAGLPEDLFRQFSLATEARNQALIEEDAARRALLELEEEARRQGALPGWLR